jgi:hypothetical protein
MVCFPRSLRKVLDLVVFDLNLLPQEPNFPFNLFNVTCIGARC